jgi:phospholipid transport system substrate-binding protein
MTHRSLLRSSVFALGLTLGVGMFVTHERTAHADAPAAATATDYLKAKQTAVTKLLATPAKTPDAIKDRDAKVDAELNKLLDYQQMAMDALGKEYFESRSEAERKEFTDLLRQLIEKNYKKRLNDTLKYQIDYEKEEAKGNDALVHTKAFNKDDKRDAVVLIDYLVRKKDGQFIVVDLIPEGSSMIKTYKKEFKKIIDKDGFPAVITKMKEKLAKP